MASCGFAEVVGGACGSSDDNPANIQCVAVGSCTTNIQGHLGAYGYWGTLIWTAKRNFYSPEQVRGVYI